MAKVGIVMGSDSDMPALHYRLWGTECLAGIRYIRGDHQL